MKSGDGWSMRFTLTGAGMIGYRARASYNPVKRWFVGLQGKLRKLQDNLRNAGWRIQHIPWQEEGKPEYYFNSPFTYVMILIGLAGFFGGIVLMAKPLVSIPVGIGIAVAGLLMLFASRFAAGYIQYKGFIKVEATCIDQEVKEFEDPDSLNSMNRITYWHPRILCEYSYKGRTYHVTPVIAKAVAFGNEESANRFLDERIGPDKRCTLWINPKNPLQTAFHKKPRMGVYTV
jgi:hypothetical protein